MTKIIIVVVLLFILGSLGSGLIFMIRDRGRGKRTVKALTWRISLSFVLFLMLLLGYATGLLKPHGVVPVAPYHISAEPQE